jgi:hypothetical protein
MPVPVTRKRAAEPAAPMTIVAKRKRVAEPDVEELEIDETYHITTSLHSKYSTFPLTLRASLQKAYANTMRIQIRALEANIITKHTYMMYCLWIRVSYLKRKMPWDNSLNICKLSETLPRHV